MSISKCMSVVERLGETDQNLLLSRIDQLQADGMAANKAAIQAATEVLTGLRERASTLFGSNIRRSVTREQALDTNVKMEMPTDKLFAEAVANTPGAVVDGEGLHMDLVRWQKPEQEAGQAIRTGVFYLPEGSANAKHYRGGNTGNTGNYGGTEKFSGRTLIRRPLFVKGATGGKAPEAALVALRGKDAMKKLDSEVFGVVNERGWMTRQGGASLFEDRVRNFLADQGADPGMAQAIIRHSGTGNQLRYALQENVIAHAVRAAGYDAVVGHSKGKNGPFISEVFDVREQTFPSHIMDSSIHEDFERDISRSADRQTDTPEFKKWFGDSKVVDAQGAPMVMYHGSGADFDAFESRRMGTNASAEGYGFYFSNDESTAKGYVTPDGGRLFDVYLSIKKPLKLNQKPFTKPQLQKIINAVAKAEMSQDDGVTDIRDTFVSNFADTYSMPFSRAVAEAADMVMGSDTAVDQIMEIANVAGDKAATLAAVREVTGHDGVHSDGYGDSGKGGGQIYLAWFPEQIKSASRNSGAFDPADANITRSAERDQLGYFSALTRGVTAMATKAAAPGAWKAQIKGLVNKGAVKQDEITWTGVEDWLDLQQGKVTKDELLSYLQEGGVKVQETVLGGAIDYAGMSDADLRREYERVRGYAAEAYGEPMTREEIVDELEGAVSSDVDGTKYSKYTLPGGENYREVLLTLPQPGSSQPTPAVRPTVVDRGHDENGRARFDVVSNGEVVDTFSTWSAAQDKALSIEENENISNNLAWQKDRPATYKSNHWEQPNVLAHIRISDRTDTDGKRVLFVEEVQSDWGQDGKKKGFDSTGKLTQEDYSRAMQTLREVVARNDYLGFDSAGQAINALASHNDWADRWDIETEADRSAITAALRTREQFGRQKGGAVIPAAPFVTKTDGWLNLALKRVVTMAADGGYDAVAFVNGQQSADHYDLSKHVEELMIERDGEQFNIAMKPVGQGYSAGGRWSGKSEELPDVVGKEMAEKIAASPEGRSYIDGEGLKVGGEGMRTFYDKIVPNAMKALLKKSGGGEMRTFDIEHDPNKTLDMWEPEDGPGDGSKADIEMFKQPGFEISDGLRAKVAGEGLPLFSRDREDGWAGPSASKWDDMVYKLQDKHVDTKRVQQAITDTSGAIKDDLNVYLQEELYHGRAAKRTEDFLNDELKPLVDSMAKDGLNIEAVDEYLHARHAKEANAVIAKRNPDMEDGGSGMTDAEADAYFSSLSADQRRKLERAAAKVDDILKETKKLYVDYELESKAKVDGWTDMFEHYVPLMREEKDGSGAMGIGQGFSIKGKEVKGRTGSTRKVVDILANIAMQRERAIVRGEKNRVSKSLVGLAMANRDTGFWTVDEVPTSQVFNPDTGFVETRYDTNYKNRDNVVVAKIRHDDGSVREHAVIFNEDDQRARRMAASLKNLDAPNLEGMLGAAAKVTRYFASINTAYNPVFGIVNLVRDVQGAALNLAGTPLEKKRAQVVRQIIPALRGIYADMRAARDGKETNSEWAKLWEEFQNVGGQTGYREQYRTSTDRAEAIKKALDPTAWMDSPLGKVFTAKGALKVPMAQAQKSAGWLFNWLEDYNDSMENGTRLAAYKAGLELGLSKEQAASIAKNLTTNFNRKGHAAQQAGALYAFFNASMQGTARIAQTLFTMEPGKPKTLRLSPMGKKIIYGGVMLGALQALTLSAAGFNDEDPPAFARERGLIIPTGGKTYITIPMPLGFHVLPNIGRIPMEFALGGFKKPAEHAVKLAALFADAFNPIGNAGLSIQTISPTIIDPLVALSENRDWTGAPIAKQSFNRATPGHELARDTATIPAKMLSEAINYLSGGTKHTAGVFSPTPDQIDYLAGQIGGGVWREFSKAEQAGVSAVTGENLPMHKIPLVGRFVGNAKSQASEGSAYYANNDKINRVETEIKGLKKEGKNAEAEAYRQKHPEALLIARANAIERDVAKLRRTKSELVKNGAPRAEVRAAEERITASMARLNRAVEELEARAK